MSTATAELLDNIDATLAADPVVPDLTPQAATDRQIRQYEPREVPALTGRRLPWAGLVTGSAGDDETLTSSELLHKAGLDWETGIRPMMRQMNDGSVQKHPFMRDVYRKDNEAALGVARSHYEPFSNVDVFAFGDSIVEQGAGRWVDAGLQGYGRRVFMTMLLNEFDVLDGDPYKMYAFFRTSHGDGTALNAWIVPFRVWCTNQQQLVNASHRGHWTILHTKNINERVEEARTSLREAADYTTEFTRLTEKLAATPVSTDRARSIFKRLIPEGRARRDERIADLMHVYKTSETVGDHRGDGYGVLNAVTETFDHVWPKRSDTARFESIMAGEGAKARAKVFRDLAGLN